MNTRKLISTMTAAVLMAGFGLFATDTANGQGRYANRYSKRDVGAIITRLETSSDQFSRDFDRALDTSRRNNSTQEDRYTNIVRDFENSVDRLRREFDRNDSWWSTRNDVQSMIRTASPVNTMMNTLPFRRNIERQWTALRNDINTVADTYDLPGLNGGGWTGGGGGWTGGSDGGWNAPGQTSAPPTWARGTFYSTDGSGIMMTITANGRVTVVNNGQSYYGTFYRNRINLNNDTSDVSRDGTGIRTYNRNTGQTTRYSRNNVGGGGGYPGGGSVSRPPSWAQGSFVAVNSPNSIFMTIAANGTITLSNNGQTFYGSFYNNTMTLNGDVSTITRTGNGIRTYNQRTGETTNYRRR